MDLGIEGRTVLVCGASRGIGFAVARRLAEAGCRIALIARDRAGLAAAADILRRSGAEVVEIAADLAHLTDYDEAVRQVTTVLGSPDIVVFNGMGAKSGGFDDVVEEDFDHSFHHLVTGFARLCRLVIPAMKEKGWGRIVTIGSNTAKQPFRGGRDTGYVLANTVRIAGVGLSKTLSAELAPFGITVNTILTGIIATENAEAWCRAQAKQEGIAPEAFIERFVARVPAGRMGTPDEMATLCAFLCSAHAGYTTGETILCDGGVSMAMI